MNLGIASVRHGLAGLPISCLLLTCAAPAAAELPDAVKAMIRAAAATGEKAKLDAVVEAARATNPDDAAEIDALLGAGRHRQAQIAAAREAEKRAEIREAGLFDNWGGEGEIGAFQSTGNSENVGITASIRLERIGIDWRHRLRASLDYQETDGITTREQYFASYEPRFQISPRLFTFALGQFDRDEFQGYDSRIALSGGLGYKVIDKGDIQLSLKAGPAWRSTSFIDGRDESSIAALAGVDFDWSITDSISFTQTTDLVAEGGGSASAIIDANNTTLNLVTGLEAGIIRSLKTRLSYAVEFDSNPPPGAESTDTRTRFTLIYGF